MLRWKVNQYQVKYAILLTLLVVMVLLPGTSARREIFSFCLALVLGACVAAVGRTSHRLISAVLISMLPIVSVFLPTDSRGQAFAHVACQAAFLLYATFMILMDVFEAQDVNRDKLLGSICAYFLVGLVFALVYMGVELWSPGSFRDVDRPLALAPSALSSSMEDFGYFSMVTMSTLGYGDIRPVSSRARSIAVLQAVFGQFYFALMVGRLMALYLRDLPQSRATESTS